MLRLEVSIECLQKISMQNGVDLFLRPLLSGCPGTRENVFLWDCATGSMRLQKCSGMFNAMRGRT